LITVGSFELKINDFFRAALKIATAIFLAITALSIAGWGIWKVQDISDKRYAKQYEVIKLWPVNLKDNLQLTLLARTKLVDGRLFAEVNFDGYPAYLSDPRLEAKNRTGSISLLFQDKDGFKVHAKSIQMTEFSKIVDATGKKSGLSFEFDEYMSPETYGRLTALAVQWTLDTVLPVPTASAPTVDDQLTDHCAPNISKTERLRRLAQHGTLRQTGDGVYEVGNRSLHFFTYDGSLINCR
jgi:hypothetical protein